METENKRLDMRLCYGPGQVPYRYGKFSGHLQLNAEIKITVWVMEDKSLKFFFAIRHRQYLILTIEKEVGVSIQDPTVYLSDVMWYVFHALWSPEFSFPLLQENKEIMTYLYNTTSFVLNTGRVIKYVSEYARGEVLWEKRDGATVHDRGWPCCPHCGYGKLAYSPTQGSPYTEYKCSDCGMRACYLEKEKRWVPEAEVEEKTILLGREQKEGI